MNKKSFLFAILMGFIFALVGCSGTTKESEKQDILGVIPLGFLAANFGVQDDSRLLP